MADFERLVTAIGRLEAMTQANQEKMETNGEEMLAEMKTNQEGLESKIEASSEKF
jgi:hypothetical protein